MTREEQIQAAARAYEQTITIAHDSSYVEADFIAGSEWADANRWVKVEDAPLIEKAADGGWIFDHDFNEFFAAVPYEDKTRPGETLWWIRHCVVEDEVGLCVVGDDENEPAGWRLEDVAYYQRLPEPPKAEQ